jgi:Epoxide hydrolase N terminus
MNEATPALVTGDDVADLIERIRRTRRVANPWRQEARRGIRSEDLDALLEYWGSGYDWRLSTRANCPPTRSSISNRWGYGGA